MADPVPSSPPVGPPAAPGGADATGVSALARRPRRARGGRRALVGSLVALAVVALVASAALARTSSGPTYRTATVVRASVAQQIHASGTVQPVAEASVSFPTSGTVASVAVNVGDPVTTGQLLATLDTTSLQATLDQRNATLAQAKLTLANAEAGQSSSSGSGSNPSGSGATATSTSTTAATSGQGSGGQGAGSGSSSASALAAAQQAVLADQQQLDHDLALARADLAAAQAACGAASPPASSSTGSTTTSTTATTAGTSAACLAAQRQLLADQTAVSNTETNLAQAERTLDGLLASSSTSSNASSTNASSTASSNASSASSASSISATSSTTPSAQELVADQAAVDAAAAEVAVAQQGLDQASIVSPINGTVAAVDLAVGDSVTADSSTQAVVVSGPGGYEVATTVSVSNRAKLELGDTATVVADGSTEVLAAKVVSIGVAGTTSGTSTTYPVVVGFAVSPTGLRNGASASVTIDLATVEAITAVPTSAVHTSGTSHTVTVLDGSATKTVTVTTGVVGAQLTQVKTGLHAGQVVVLADLDQALPSSDSTSTSRRSGLTGGGLTTGSSGFSGGFGASGGGVGGSGGPPGGGG